MNQKGFSLVEGLIIVLVLAVVSFGGYYAWSQQKEESATSNNASIVSGDSTQKTEVISDEASGLYLDEELDLSIELREGWKAISFDDRTSDATYLPYGMIISKNGQEITISTSGQGGRGSCFEEEGYIPTPHSADNTCSTYEIITLTEAKSLKDDSYVYVTGVKYSPGGTDQAEYVLSMYQSDTPLSEGDVLYNVYKVDDKFDYYQVTSTFEGYNETILTSDSFTEAVDMLSTLRRI